MATDKSSLERLEREARIRNEKLNQPVKVTVAPNGGSVKVENTRYTSVSDALKSRHWDK